MNKQRLVEFIQELQEQSDNMLEASQNLWEKIEKQYPNWKEIPDTFLDPRYSIAENLYSLSKYLGYIISNLNIILKNQEPIITEKEQN